MTSPDFSGLGRAGARSPSDAKARHLQAISAAVLSAALLLMGAAARADEPPAAAAGLAPAAAAASAPAAGTAGGATAGATRAEPGGASPPAPAVSEQRHYEGAVGLIFSQSASYPGARETSNHLTPAGFIRWGRYTVTGAGGFTTRRKDDVERGLGAELLRRPSFHLRLGLRLDNGRSQDDSPRLAGMGTIDSTLRGRLVAQWDVATNWRLGMGLSTDLLGRGGGSIMDISVAREFPLPKSRLLVLSADVAAADSRYMQSWHGVSAEQAQRSGLPAYEAGAGLRHVQLGAVWREELTSRWAGFVGVSAMQLIGPAADSPLTLRGTSTSVSTGLVWRF